MKSIDVSNNAGLIWITGYSGAGKTTVARLVFEQLKKNGIPTVFLDGDEIRSILGERFGHELEERRKLASVYGRLCKSIVDSGVSVVIATVAMFDSVRAENRASIDRYIEVYLKVPFNELCERDPKGIYKAALKKGATPGNIFAGFEEPISPNLQIENFGDISPMSAAAMILKEVATCFASANSWNADHVLNTSIEDRQEYWDGYYKKRKAPISPSSFALFCSENYLTPGQHILEFGCGNGRDSFYFAAKYSVLGLDASKVVVAANNARVEREGFSNLSFISGEFGRIQTDTVVTFDACYARFVMHAMSEDAEDLALKEAWRILKIDGLLLLEFRTDKDALMQQGSTLSAYERVTDHYRRFINFASFCAKVERKGFSIEYALEREGLASHGADDPVVGRIVARKT